MNFSNIYFYFVYGSLLAALLPLFTGVTFFHRLNKVTTPFLFFFYYVVLSESFSFVLSRYSTNTLWWMNINQLLELIFFGWFFLTWITENAKIWFTGFLIIFLPYWIYSTCIINDFYTPNSFAHAIECLVIVLLAGIVLIRLSKSTAISLFRNPQFWLASGAMIYFSFSVLIYAIYQVIVNNNYKASLFEPVWILHSFMNIFSNLLYSIAFLCPVRTFKSLKAK